MTSTPERKIKCKCPLAPKKRKRIVRPRQVVARQLNFDVVAIRNYLLVRGRRVPTELRPTQLF